MKKVAIILISLTILTALVVMSIPSGESKRGPVEGRKNIKLAIEEFDYEWNFYRNYNTKIKKSYQGDYFSSLYKVFSLDEQIVGIDETTEELIFFERGSFEVERKFGSKGGDPLENERIKSIDYDQGFIYMVDNSRAMVKKLDNNGILLKYKKFDFYLDNGVYIGDGRFVLSGDDKNSGEYGLKIYSIEEDRFISEFSFESVIEPESKDLIGIVYEGNLLKTELYNGFIYYCYRTGLFLRFEHNGDLVYRKKTIDETPVPKPVHKDLGGGYTSYDAYPPQVFQYSASVVDGHLFILSNIAANFNKEIDIYNLDNGDYLGSIALPNLEDGQKPKEILVEGSDLVVLYENMTLVCYEMDI